VPDDGMLWKGTTLMRCAQFSTINSVLSNATVPRPQSSHVFGVPIEKRPLMTEHDVRPEHPNLNEGCDPPQGGTLRTSPAIGPAVTAFKTDLLLNSYDAARRASELTHNLTN
jgi:hypothetical protein